MISITNFVGLDTATLCCSFLTIIYLQSRRRDEQLRSNNNVPGSHPFYGKPSKLFLLVYFCSEDRLLTWDGLSRGGDILEPIFFKEQ